MDICAALQTFCKTISHFHHKPVTHTEPNNASNIKQCNNGEGKQCSIQENKNAGEINKQSKNVEGKSCEKDEKGSVSKNNKQSNNGEGCTKDEKENLRENLNEREEKQSINQDSSNNSGDFPTFTIRRNVDKNTTVMYSHMHRRSSSLSHKEVSKRKRRKNSIFGDDKIYPPLKTSKSFDSKIKTKVSPTSVVKRRTNNYNDPVRDQWANKGAAVYYAQSGEPAKQKPTTYWIHRELKYVVVLPTDKPKRKPTKIQSPPTLPPPPSPPTRPSPTPSTQSETKQWEPYALEGKDLGPQEKESFASVDSSEDYVPRSEAKYAIRPTGRFCCMRRQDSG